MGFGRGKGFTAKPSWNIIISQILILGAWGKLVFQVTGAKLISTVSLAALAASPISESTSGKLISTRATEVTLLPVSIGSPAIARPSLTTAGYTFILKENPASRSGTILRIEIYAAVNCEALEVGIFYSTGANTFTTRSSVTIGAVIAGEKRTFEVNLAVEAGDYIGFYEPTGRLERTDTSGEGYWYVQLDAIPAVDQLFTNGTDLTRTISLYGTSEE